MQHQFLALVATNEGRQYPLHGWTGDNGQRAGLGRSAVDAVNRKPPTEGLVSADKMWHPLLLTAGKTLVMSAIERRAPKGAAASTVALVTGRRTR